MVLKAQSPRLATKLIAVLLASTLMTIVRSFGVHRLSTATSHGVAKATQLHLSVSQSLSNEEIARYSRHLVLSDVGMKGQIKLKNSSVLVVGAGGLGSPCLLYLAAAGVGHIGIVDGDTVDESNLQRQIIHSCKTVGVSKCQSAQERIKEINPFVNVRLYEMEFTSQSALDILQEGFDQEHPYDIVIDGSDNFPTKYLINDACAIVRLPWVYSAILAFEGQLSVFNLPPQNPDADEWGPDYRDMLPTPPPPGDVPSCAEGGVVGVLPGTMGCLQATECIKYLLGHTSGLVSGRVLVMNAMTMKFSEMGLKRSEGREKITKLIDYQGFCAGPSGAQVVSAASSQASNAAGGRTMDEVEEELVNVGNMAVATAERTFHSIAPKECLDKMVNQGWAPWVLDVRLQTENDIVALPFTDRVSPHRTVSHKDIPDKGDVLIYCKAGVRGKKACNRLIEMGVVPERLFNLEGGILGWQAEVDSSMPRY